MRVLAKFLANHYYLFRSAIRNWFAENFRREFRFFPWLRRIASLNKRNIKESIKCVKSTLLLMDRTGQASNLEKPLLGERTDSNGCEQYDIALRHFLNEKISARFLGPQNHNSSENLYLSFKINFLSQKTYLFQVR